MELPLSINKDYILIIINDLVYTMRWKFIAHLPLNNSPILKGLPLLPPLPDDVEKLAEKEIPFVVESTELKAMIVSAERGGFVKGYNKAKEDERNKLTPFKNLIALVENGFLNGTIDTHNLIIDEIIVCKQYLESLSQPKLPTHFKLKMEQNYNEVGNDGFEFDQNSTLPPPKPKIINGVMQGEWVFN